MSGLVQARAGNDVGTSAARDGVLVGGDDDGTVRWREGERLHQLFEDRADELWEAGRGDHLAVDAGDETLTYGQLDGRANQLARQLLERGVRPGDRVGLLFDSAVHSYTAMLAVLKVHAAYVPLDVGFPADRLSYIVGDAEVRTVLSLSHLRDRLEGIAPRLLCLDELGALAPAQDDARLTDAERGAPVDELCYVIYTSGSTGRPKGVAVDHASIVNFLRVAAETYGIEQRDRVYQGLTIAFDFSFEEIWVPFVVGATLVPKPGGSSLLGQELHEFLTDHRVTAMCCVPTLLATLDEDLPELRFLLVSGEACPQDLIKRWSRSGRRFLNVYGPTEATVTATWTVARPDGPGTIGVPLPTYSVVVLAPDEPRALRHGEMGEIGIAGIGLARGYLNRDDLTRKAFIPDFLGIEGNPSGRIYRTGDLGRINADGEVEYHGRIDLQVKIRGYRIELTEIESVLMQVSGIAQAVVDTYQPEPGVVELVGYYTLRPGAPEIDEQHLYEELRAQLPSYMVPAYLQRLAVMPMTSSDKADRKNLPAPTGRRGGAQLRDYVAPATATEQALAELLAQTLGVERVSADSLFFDDLGANSLTMARFCARVRGRADLAPVAMRDVYQHPSVRDLAASLSDTTAALVESGEVEPVPVVTPVSTAQYVTCGALQLLIFLLYTYLSGLVLVTGYEVVSRGEGLLDVYVRTLLYGAATFLGLGSLPVVAKWVLIGRWRPQEFPVWSLAYVRFWLVKTLIRSSPFALFVGSPLYVLYLRALGAKIGRGVVILSRTMPVCTDLLTIGDGAVIRKDSFFPCYRAYAGRIQTGPVTLGRDVFLGEKTVLDIRTSMGDSAQLGHQSSLQAGQAVPAGETWHGSPAQRAEVDYRTVPTGTSSTLRRFTFGALQMVSALFLYLPALMVVVAVVLPDLLASDRLEDGLGDWRTYPVLMGTTLLLFLGGVLAGLVFVLTVPRLLHRALAEDVEYPLYGIRYAIHRTVTRMTNAKFYIDLFGDSSYITTYLRALGCDLSEVVQTGSNFGTELAHESPYLSTIGTGTMVSDALSLMNTDYSSTSFRLSRVTVGARNFLGNNIAFPAGARTGENVLLATKVLVPVDGPVRKDVGLLGSPPFEIPRSVFRDSQFDLSEDAVRRGLAAKNRHNAVTMALFLLHRWFAVFCVTVLAAVAASLYDDLGMPVVPVASLVVLVFLITYGIATERAVLKFGRLRPQLCSIYEPYFWWHERLWKLIGSAPFTGTPFKNVFWRMLGVRMGRRVFDDGCEIPEKTLVTIGDDCTLNAGSVIQCHSLEDGAFKSDHTTLGAGVTLGLESFVHYGVTMGDGAVLDPDAFLMKGEDVPALARWGGNPAREVRQVRQVPAAAQLPVAPDAVAPPVVAVVATPADDDAAAAAALGSDGTGVSPADASGEVRVATTPSLLDELTTTAPQLSDPAGARLLLFPLEECRRREAELAQLLSTEEQERARAMASPERRTGFVVSRALLRMILSAQWRPDVAPGDWRFGRTALGKLIVQEPEGLGLDVSISYTEHVVAVAVSDTNDVGVDVEPWIEDEDSVIWSVLTPAERSRLEATPAADRPAEFLRMWTLKEAYVKCTGAGASRDFEHLDTSSEPPAVLADPGDEGTVLCLFTQETWTVSGQPHCVTVAARPRVAPRSVSGPRQRPAPAGPASVLGGSLSSSR